MSAALIRAVSNGQQGHSHSNNSMNTGPHAASGEGIRHHDPHADPHAGHAAAHHAAPHRHGHHPHAPPPKKNMRIWYWLLGLSAAVGLAFLIAQLPPGLPHLTGAELSHQIEAAAKGASPEERHDGIVIRLLSSGGVMVVTADQVPPKLCVSAGWDLVKDGTLTINGVTPLRVSAARLAELCNANPPATLVWTPEPAS